MGGCNGTRERRGKRENDKEFCQIKVQRRRRRRWWKGRREEEGIIYADLKRRPDNVEEESERGEGRDT